jgi:hypothetical protein
MPDFWLALLVRVGASALVVVAATVVAEAAGPFLGALLVSLPLAGGAAYVMLALQNDAVFVAASALTSLAVNAASFVFLAAMALLARRVRWWLALGGALAVWFAAALAIRLVPWNVAGAILLNMGSLGASVWATRSVPREAISGAVGRRRWYELPIRAIMVGLVIGTVVSVSRLLGPATTGMAAVFPVVFTSFALVVLPRLGGDVGAAIMASAVRAMPGFALALLVVHLAAEPLGVGIALPAALLASLAWSALLMVRRGRKLRLA